MLKIKELREEANITQKQLAEAIHNMQRNVSNWEKGVSEPDLNTVVALADYFGVTLDELFGREPYPKIDSASAALYRTIAMLTSAQKNALQSLLELFRNES